MLKPIGGVVLEFYIISFLSLVTAPAQGVTYALQPALTYFNPTNIPSALNIISSSCFSGTTPTLAQGPIAPVDGGPAAADWQAGGPRKGGDNSIATSCTSNIPDADLTSAQIAFDALSEFDGGIHLCDSLPCDPIAGANFHFKPGKGFVPVSTTATSFGSESPPVVHFAISVPNADSRSPINYVTGYMMVNYGGGTQVGNGANNIAIKSAPGQNPTILTPIDSMKSAEAGKVSAMKCSLSPSNQGPEFQNILLFFMGTLFCMGLRRAQARQWKKMRIHLNKII